MRHSRVTRDLAYVVKQVVQQLPVSRCQSSPCRESIDEQILPTCQCTTTPQTQREASARGPRDRLRADPWRIRGLPLGRAGRDERRDPLRRHGGRARSSHRRRRGPAAGRHRRHPGELRLDRGQLLGQRQRRRRVSPAALGPGWAGRTRTPARASLQQPGRQRTPGRGLVALRRPVVDLAVPAHPGAGRIRPERRHR
jgi:hypothetical protein